MATYNFPVVPQFPAGYAPVVGDFDTWWYQTASFLQNKIVARLAQTTATTSLPTSGAQTLITLDTALEDPYSGFSASTHYWTPPTGYSAWYGVTATLQMNNTTALIDVSPALSIQSSPAYSSFTPQVLQISTSGNGGASITYRVYLNGGVQSVGLTAGLFNASAAISTSITAGQQSTLEIVWISN